VSRILSEVGFTSNYVVFTSNILVKRILAEDIFTSNYIASTSNILVKRILAEDIFTSNYIASTSNILVNYNNLINKPTIPAAQVSSDWTSVSGISIILNKPTLFSGSYTDLSNKPTLFSGSYTDLSNKPTIPAAQVSSDWTSVSGISIILNKPTLFSGSYTDLSNKPTLFSGSYTDLSNKPTIPAAQVSSDWTSVSGISIILNKPTLFSGSYTDLSDKPAFTSSQWTTSNNMINYNTSNVGIGTFVPTSKLHIYDGISNETKLIIQNNTSNIYTNEISVVDTISTIIDENYRMIEFPFPSQYATSNGIYPATPIVSKSYNFTPTQNLICTILVVGGGGGGGRVGGGGGSGAILFGVNIKLTAGNLVSVKVGNGGRGADVIPFGSGINGINGADSSITINSIEYIAKGGGGGGTGKSDDYGNLEARSGSTGGCGGGGSCSGTSALPQPLQGLGGISNKNNYLGFQSFGNSGGNGKLGLNMPQPIFSSGGGGGAGSVGGNFSLATGGGNGGRGLNFRKYFGNQVGDNGWFGGGGGGQTYMGVGNIGYANGGKDLLGGGGNGGFDGNANTVYSFVTDDYILSKSGKKNTGGGGGGSMLQSTQIPFELYCEQFGGSGGTGYVIIRYINESSLFSLSSSLELVAKGTTAINNAVNYRIGNYNKNFKIISYANETSYEIMDISSTGEVGIGIASDSNVVTGITDPLTYKLNVNGNVNISNNSSNTSVLSINNNFTDTIEISSGPPVIIVSGGTSISGQITNSTDRYMIFTNGICNFSVPAGNYKCDILMIGGGGGGGSSGGGGAGSCIVAINQLFSQGSYVIEVGAGGIAESAGGDTKISVNSVVRYISKGGGRGGNNDTVGGLGGCGGGGGYTYGTKGLASSSNVVNYSVANIAPSITSNYGVFGTIGGWGANTGGGGGGGIGECGQGASSGRGGDGLYQATINNITYNFRTYFANNTTIGVNVENEDYSIGGGGGGNGGQIAEGVGGRGGGGNGFNSVLYLGNYVWASNLSTAGLTNTGSGGGGGTASVSGTSGSLGGSGIVIIRYRSVTSVSVIGTPTIELSRGTKNDTNLDYKIQNYNGDFKITSSISSQNTDIIVINNGNVGIGTTNSLYKLNVDGSLNATSLSITNNVTFKESLISSPVANVSGIITGSTDKFMIFKTTGINYTFTIPKEGINCDILMIGGGGGSYWGGGGAGTCIVAINQILPAGSCIVRVGNGATGFTSTNNGEDSYITVDGIDRYRAKGGGTAGATLTSTGVNGGCGSGASKNASAGGTAVLTNVVNGTFNISPSTTTTYAVFGTSGGNGTAYSGGGGGGANLAGTHAVNVGVERAGSGGAGIESAIIGTTQYNFRTWFANGGTFGYDNNGYIGGGGGGMSTGQRMAGGNGVGGTAASENTGNGANGSGVAGTGSSGIIIIRYRPLSIVGAPSIELIRGTNDDSNTDYKLVNYNGDLKIISSKSSQNTDIFVINNSNVVIGTNAGETYNRLNVIIKGFSSIRDTLTTSLYETRFITDTQACLMDMRRITDTDATPSIFRLGGGIGNPNAITYDGFNNAYLYFRIFNLLGNNSTTTRTWTYANTGSCFNALNTTTWNTASDHRIKENIKKANLNICYDNVKNINLYRYNYINGFKNGLIDKTQLGFIAQQVKQHFPKSISRDKIRLDDKREVPDLASVDVSQVNFTLFGAVKQLMKVVEKQSKRIKKLEEMLNIINDDIVDDDADEPYERIACNEVDIDTIVPSKLEGV
jgi:hypothetical protein